MDIGRILEALKPVSKGEPVTRVASSDRINAIQDILLYLLRGDNIRGGQGIRKSATLGHLRLSTKRRERPKGDLPKQWELRRWTDEKDSSEIAQIRSGTITGLGINGYAMGWVGDKWNNISALNKVVWIKVSFDPISEERVYATSEDSTATIYVIIGGNEGEAEIIFTDEETIPEDTHPRINIETGNVITRGVYHARVGSLIDDQPVINDYIGPLGVSYCPPTSVMVYQLT